MNVLVFFAHPDDETMLAGGTLALFAQHGAQVHYLCATRGDGGEVGDPPLCKPEELGEMRSHELKCAVNALGGSSTTNLGYSDPKVGPAQELYPFTTNLTRLSGQLVSIIRDKAIDVLISHGTNGEYGHPAHRLCNQAARLAVSSIKANRILFFTFAAAYPDHPKPRIANRDDPADLILNIRPVLNYKIQAALCHRTQHALFIRRMSLESGRRVKVPEVLLKEESLHRSYPAVQDDSGDAVTQLLLPWVAE